MDGHLAILEKVKQLILSFHTLLIAVFHENWVHVLYWY